ncbi:MAG: hypothetical protein F6K00_18465 [Leptolyngbya sp. SIOISBB]|nr:hypothetical protein [Leptolyngbya sp. SIOISBB]
MYESLALYSWQEAQPTQGQPYQIYYLNPPLETISTAATPPVPPEHLLLFGRHGFRLKYLVRINASG